MRRLIAWLAGRPAWQRWAIALLSGAFATLAVPPVYILPALLVAFPALFCLVESARSPRAAIALGWWFGAGHFLSGLYWVGNALEVAGAPPFLALSLPLGIALFPAAAMGLYSWTRKKQGERRLETAAAVFGALLLFAICWSAFEWLRGHLLTGFPWNLAAYGWGFSETMSQAVSLMGAYGLTFFTVLVALLPLTVLAPALGRLRWLGPAAALFLLVAQGAYGYGRLAHNGQGEFTDLQVRIVQAAIPQSEKWQPFRRNDHFLEHMRLSGKSGIERVDILVWPEVAVPFYLTEDPGRTVMMGRLVRPGGVVLTGAPRRQPGEDGQTRYYNSLLAIDAGGEVRHVYDKHHLVPFGEYVPFRPVFTALGIERLVEAAGDMSPGPGRRVLDLPGKPPVQPLICYETIFPGAVTADQGPRPGWLLNVTNDAWFGDSAGPRQHFTIARFRAIEEGLPLVRSAGSGISAIVDPYGRITARFGLNKKGILDGLLPRPAPPTLYARAG
ncbi:MAG: apolipoprotein N-acyltransferase, partial [Alphaproteobacteria bacterium]|nr:apolipoprotein N-acyltransferase [Alphaproteobacteria bacterium]